MKNTTATGLIHKEKKVDNEGLRYVGFHRTLTKGIAKNIIYIYIYI